MSMNWVARLRPKTPGQLAWAIVRRTPLLAVWLRWCAYRQRVAEVAAWNAAGRPAPPPHYIKQQVLKEYARTHRLRILVETGTYLGDMVHALGRHFDRIYSIELSETLFNKARDRFRARRHIELLRGNSGTVLALVVTRLTGPALFWLDGHYSGGSTAKGRASTPIMAELTHILACKKHSHVIVIDDARCFGTESGYPSIPELETFIRSLRPDVAIAVEHDSIRVTPSGSGW
jgi:hypothetical protein